MATISTSDGIHTRTITVDETAALSGGATVVGGATVDTLISTPAALLTVTSSQVISPVGARIIRATVAAGATASGLSLAAGINGQELTIINENATGASTLIASTGTLANITISGQTGARLIFDTTNSWVKC